MGKPAFPPGFRFSPTHVELVRYYLKRKVLGKSVRVQVVADVDIYRYEPWDLPDKSCWPYGDRKWYFFCPREMKYATGGRINRATGAGFWKMSGKDRSVSYNGQVVGMIKTLVFHTGRPPQEERTDWVLHEYRLEDKGLAEMGVPLESYVLCVLFQKEGAGPRNGTQYGAPFKEEDWSDDEVNISVDTVTHENRPEPDPVLPRGYSSPAPNSTVSPEGICIGPSSGSCVSDVVSNYCNVSHSVSKEKHRVSANGDIVSMLDGFTEESTLPINDNDNDNDKNKELDNLVQCGTTSTTQKLDNLNSRNADAPEEHDHIFPSGNVVATDDFYKDLTGLGNLGVVEDGFTFNNDHDCPYTMDDIFELGDLDRPFEQ